MYYTGNKEFRCCGYEIRRNVMTETEQNIPTNTEKLLTVEIERILERNQNETFLRKLLTRALILEELMS